MMISPWILTGIAWIVPSNHGFLARTVAPDLIEAVSTASPTSRTIWLGLEEQFIENKETRAIILDAEFRTLVQGDLSITDYCNKMKRMADDFG
jgi:hypothetical protein